MELQTINIPQAPVIRTRGTKNERILSALESPEVLIRELGGFSLYEFMQCFWNEISEDEFRPNWHIEYLCKELEEIAYRVAEGKRKKYDLIINVPPGTTKTITCSIMFPAWTWTKWPWMKHICASYSAALALESAEKCRDLLRSDKFKMVYPELSLKQDKDTKSNFRVVKEVQVYPGRVPRLQYGGGRFSTSVGGTLMGFHGHILIIDDPLSPNQAASDTELQSANRWMEQTLPTRKIDKGITPTILIMQRLHQDDPSGHLLNKNKSNVRQISLPGEIRNYRHKVIPPELVEFYKDDLLDPTRMTWESLKDLEADLGQYGYAGQVGQDPTPPGGGMFKVDHFQMITTLPAPINHLQTVRYWDKAGSQGAGCYTVGVKMARYTQDRFIVLDVKRGQWGTLERERIIKETAQADGRDVTVYIEQEPGSGGKESAEATIRNLNGFAVRADHPTGDKAYRADPFSVQVNAGNVYLMTALWNHDYIEEHRFFPFSTYKDQVDASSGAFNHLAGKRQATML